MTAIDTIVRDGRDRSWMVDAACRGMDPNLFFPAKGVNLSPLVRAMCARCPVREQCADYGRGERYGAWGGGSTKALRQARRRAERIDGAPPVRPLAPIVHGSRHGAEQHRQRGEKPCEACLDACRRATNALRREARVRQVVEIHVAHIRTGCECLIDGAVVAPLTECCRPECRCHRVIPRDVLASEVSS